MHENDAIPVEFVFLFWGQMLNWQHINHSSHETGYKNKKDHLQY